jgi:site-specific DNA recombinase
MTSAAIYARKSTEQNGVADDAKSVTRQIEGARAFAAARGWRVDDEHVYVDDGISGAEFKRRPGFQRLLARLEPRPPFQVLVVAEQKAIGREAVETSFTIKRLALAGVEVFEYVHGTSLTPKNAMEKVVGALRGFGDETHREQTSERGHEALLRLARAGHVTGGRVFGYTNQDVFNGVDVHGRPLRSHVERVINPTEADVVRRIYQMYDEGYGLKRIAKLLTQEGAAAPKPFVRRDATKVGPVSGWAPSTIRAVLTRELYRGVVVWNRSRKRPIAWGQVNQQPRPEGEWLRVEAEHLRLVDEALWKRVESRRQETEGRAARFASGRLSGRPPKTPTPNLLAGLATCGLCGGSLVVETSGRKDGRVPQFVCYRRRHNGTCANNLRVSVAEMNEAVLYALEEHALTPEAIERVIHLTERDELAERLTALTAEGKQVEKRIARLVAAIEAAGDIASLAAKLRELEARRVAIDREAADLRPIPRLPQQVIEDRLAEWRRLLRSSTTQARTVIQRIVKGRIIFTPRVGLVSGEVGDGVADAYDFSASTRFDKLFTGLAMERPKGEDEGFLGSEGIGPEDTFDGDYGRLLEAAYRSAANYGKGVASPAGTDVGWQLPVRGFSDLNNPAA